MKKSKLIIPVMVIAMTAGLAFASTRNHDEAIPGKFIQLPGECQSVPKAECGNGEELCTYQGQQVYGIQNDENPTECSMELRQLP